MAIPRSLSSLSTLGALLLSTLALSTLGCPKADDKKDTPAATDKKTAGDDDDDSTKDKKKSKKKKEGDDDDDSSKDKKKQPDDQAAADDSLDGGRIEDGGTEAKAPVPPACAPDAAGRLGAKPHLIASGGEPGASIAVWTKAGDAAPSTFAVTLHADGKCYVDYVSVAIGGDPSQTFAGIEFPKGAIVATAGIAERGSNSFVGFRVLSNELRTKAGELHTESFARFYGYEHAEGEPYSCGALAGEKGCAMYQKALVAHVGSACSAAKGGGPPALGAQPKIGGGGVAGAGKLPTIAGTITLPTAVAPDAGTDAGTTCNGPTCATSAFMVKEKDHVFVRVAAGKPAACDAGSGPRVGDTWFFADSAWKKR